MAKSLEAREAMQGADISANLALTVARDAQTVSKEASEAAANISREAEKSRGLAEELSAAAESLKTKVSDTKGQLADKEGVAVIEGEAAQMALSKANQAQIKAKEAKKKVEEARKELDDIAAILSTVQEPGNFMGAFFLFPDGRSHIDTRSSDKSSVFAKHIRAWFAGRARQEGGGCRGKVPGSGPGPSVEGIGSSQEETGELGIPEVFIKSNYGVSSFILHIEAFT